MSVKIKLCGMFRDCDIDYVNEAKPDYIGFIVMFPKSHRNIDFETALRLKKRLSPDIKSVAVSVNAPVEQFSQFAKSGVADMLQLHGDENAEYIAELRKLTEAPLIKAVRVTSPDDIIKAQELDVDFLLLDSGTGSGKVFDHSLIDRESIKKPFFLAGGLTPENVREAALSVKPYGVDMSSGIETDKVKDREKMLAAVQIARSIFSGDNI